MITEVGSCLQPLEEVFGILLADVDFNLYRLSAFEVGYDGVKQRSCFLMFRRSHHVGMASLIEQDRYGILEVVEFQPVVQPLGRRSTELPEHLIEPSHHVDGELDLHGDLGEIEYTYNDLRLVTVYPMVDAN